MLDVKSDWTDIGEPDADTVAKLNEIFAPKAPEIRDAAYYRRKWVEAARSGQYRQITGQLMEGSGYGFCILGLGCEVVREDFGFYWDVNNCFCVDGDGSDGCDWEIPKQVAEIFGLRDVAAWFQDISCPNSLVGLNDNGKTFAELADLIESEPLGLFK